MIYNEVLLTRQIPRDNANWRIFCAAGNNKKVSKRRNRATGRRATLPPGGSAGSWYVFRMGGKMWVRRLTHILTRTVFNIYATKKHRKPKFSMLFGAAGRIRTADLILTKRLFEFFLTIFALYGHICSNPLAFRHSSNALPPYTPHRTVAENVVKNAPSPLPEIFSRLGQGIIPGKRPKIGFHNQ